MAAEWVSAVANVILALGAVGTGIWATWTYRDAKKADKARWQKQIFDDLFLSGKFEEVREALELNFDSGLGRIIELSVQERDEQIESTDRKLLLQLDNFLNLLEYVLYLEQDRHQIEASDRDALLGYWLEVIKDRKRSSLRYYASHYGYERLTALTGASCDTFLILYGSLRRGQPKFDELELGGALEYMRPCQFDGQLYDLGEYPGAVPGPGKIVGEVYRVKDESVFSRLDQYEEFDVSDPAASLFIRRCIHVDGVGDAWVYLFNGARPARSLLPSGDWLNKSGAGADRSQSAQH